MTRFLAALSLTLAALAIGVPAAGETGPHFTRYWVDAVAEPGGSIEVRIEMEYDFADLESHGVYLSFLTRQRIEGDPEHYRAYEISGARAASPTAPADVREERTEDGVGFYIGDPDVGDVTGVHTYQLSFTIDGIVTSGVGEGGEDEVYWNIIGTGFDEPLADIRVSLHAPNPLTGGCWAGEAGSTDTCEVTGDGTQVVFTHDRLEAGEGMTIAAAYPGGTFNDVEPILVPRATFANTMGTPPIVAAGIAGSILAAAGAYFGVRWRRRDERYEDLTPGLLPPPGTDARIGRAPVTIEPAVQFTPPPGLRPAEIGGLLTGVAAPRHHAATIVDLAVRGHVAIEPSGTEWNLRRRSAGEEDLSDYERELLEAIFHDSDPVRLSELSAEAKKALVSTRKTLQQRMRDLGWFVSPPTQSRTGVLLGATLLLAAAGPAIGLASGAGLGMLGFIPPAAGLGRLAAVRHAPKRTAAGHAMYVQALGFKKYLATAEANQLRFEAEEDIFSAYLPHAMVFGVANRWVQLFQELAAQGQWTIAPRWYPAQGNVLVDYTQAAQLASSLEAMARTATSVGSAASSGGGSVGGGAGGGGGGRW